MYFSARHTRLAILSLLGFVLVGSCLFAGAKLWQRRHSSQQSGLRNGTAGSSEHSSTTAVDQTASLPAGHSTDSDEMRALFKHLKEKRAELEEGRYDKPNEALEFFRLKRLAAGQTEIPTEKYLLAYRQMELMPRHSFGDDKLQPSRKQAGKSAALPAWTSLGPGNVGGRTRTIVIHPTTPTTMYAAGVAGGVWKTTNGGANWSPTSDLTANLAINSLAIDSTNPNTLYAGTGEGTFNGDAVRGAGIFKTTDGGATWTQLANTTSTDFYYVNDIVISPNNANRIYAATRTGIWRSTDGGTNWTKVQNVTEVGSTTVAINGGCLDLAIRTDKPTDYVFASCGNQTQARIFRNTDAGGSGTWTQVHTEASAGRTSLAIAPSNQDIVYALSAELDGTFDDALHAVFRSVASGDAGTWEARVRNSDPNKLNASILSFAIGAFATNCGYDTTNFFGAQAWYDNVIAVDPTDPQRVWVGGVDVFRSDDGGANWGMATHAYQSRTNPQYAHPDQHVIVFHPQFNGSSNQTVFIGNDGGIFRSDNARAVVATGNNAPCNAAATAVNWISLNNGYGVTQFYHGSVYPNGTKYFGGAQDNGTIRGSDSAGANAWNEIWPGDGGYTAIDPTNTNILFTANTDISVQKSTDGGATFFPAVSGISDSGLFITPYVMDPSDPQRLFLGGNLFIWRTKNGAASWQQASAITPGSGSVSAITVSPTNSNFAMAGMSDGFIIRTDQALTSTSTTTWQSVQPRTGYVSSLAFDPTNKDIMYATYSTFGGVHVWRTVNAGLIWTGLNGTGTGILPDVPVHSIVIDPTNTMRLYIGTDVGVFSSVDGGATWAVENTNFANVITEWLTINSTSNTTQLFAFTHGRGAWRATANPTGCNYALTPASQTFTDAGGNGTIAVTAEPSGCNWTAVSNAAWITINSGTSGTTNGTIAFSVAAFTGTSPRIGTITAAGKTFTVTQNGCATIASSFQYFEAAGGTGSIPVTATSGCTWTTTGNPSWVTINSGAAGTGNGTVAFTVAANTLTTARQTILTVAGQSFTILQGGASGTCAITPITVGQAINGTISPSDCGSLRAPTFPTDRYSFTGTAGQRVAIRADSNIFDTFLYLIDPTGAVVASNDNGSYRTDARIPAGTGFFTLPSSGTYQVEVLSAVSASAIGAYTISLSNGSVNCSYSAAPSEQNFATAGGNGSVNVSVTGNGCDWTATSNAAWVTINSGATGSGIGTVNFTVAANTGFSRTAYLIVGGQLVTITQAGTGAIAIGRWATQASGTTNQLNHVYFLDDNQGWTVGVNSSARSTSNGGTAWNGFTVGGTPQNYNSVKFLDTVNGWVGGERITALTANGGANFGRLEFSTGTRNRLFPTTTTDAFGVGERNGGGFHASSFIFLALLIGNETPGLTTLSNLRDVYFSNPGNGWSVGDKGQIFRLTKAGNFYDEQTGATAQNLNGVFALDLATAWAVGDGGIILKTTNAGQTWLSQPSGVTTALRDIHFINADRGWAVGDAGVILVTWNGGATWTPEASGVTADLRSVHTNTINAVYAVGANGTIVKRALCTYALSATSASFAEAGGSGSVNVTSVAGCPWTATSNASWITINSGTPGSGNGTLNFTVAANTGLARTGTITVAGQTFTVNQSVACPTITGFTPLRSGVGGSVVITGTNFTEVTSVKFANNVTALFTVNSATQLTATVPAGAVTGPITISKTGCGDVQTTNFIFCNPITINPATLNAGATGLTFNQTLTATGGTAAYSFAVTTGSLPSGLALTPSGTLSGAPIVAGTFNFIVTATDANGCTGTRAYSLVVACPTITLSPTTLPNGLVGSAYNQTVSASPGLNAGTYSYSVTTGSLPAGLSLNAATGAIAGTPTTGGTSNFTITALTTSQCGGSQSYSIFVQPLCPTVTGINPTSGIVGANVTITGTNLTGVDSVKFASGVSATFTVVSNTQITATVPAGAVTGAITVSKQFCSDVTSANYTVLPTPTITLTPPTPLIGVGQTATFTATISPALPTAITLTLTSSNSTVAAVPVNPSIPAGQTSAQFTVAGASAGTTTIAAAVPALYGTASASSALTVAAGFEGDVSPRPNGNVNGQVTTTDWNQVGRFIAGLDSIALGSEFQRADCAPRGTLGNGQLTASDWVQAGRYAAGLDPVVAVGGPTAPTPFTATEDSSSFTAASASLIRAEMVPSQSLAAAGKDQQVIKLTAQGGENAVSFSLMFEPAKWRFLIAELTDETAGATLIVNRDQAAEGRLGFMFAYPTGKTLSPGEIRLFTVTFTPVESLAESLFVGFGDVPTAREISDANASRLPSNFAADYSFASATASANVSAASFAADRLAADQIVAAFGSNLSAMTAVASSLPLPTSLGGATVKITDSKGVERLAGLFFVSAEQINYLLPAGLAEGIARVVITANGKTSVGLIDVAPVAPSLFTANSDGQGLAAAVLLRVRADGSQSYEAVTRFDSTQNRFVAVPIDFGEVGDQLYLSLYGTGLRHHAGRTIKASIGGLESSVQFVGAAEGFAGLDQLNLSLPRSLAGRGEAESRLMIGDRSTNPVKIVFH